MTLQEAITELAGLAADWTGFSREAILADSVRRALGNLDLAEAVRRARQREPAMVHLLCQAVSVGETYLFRHPEHFRWLASGFVRGLVERGATAVRAWSAGCATGEETYSVAACLLDLVPPDRARVEVLGTDLVERNLAQARAATYGTWSRRAAGPILHPLGRAESDRLRIDGRIREVTRFEIHNLLDPPPAGGPFDLILCRNVLVYFSPEASSAVVRNLLSALKPEGALIFGPMDLVSPPPGLVPAARPEDQVWMRPPPPGAAPVREKKPQGRQPPAVERRAQPVRLPAAEPVALHLRALRHIERGERKVADHALDELCRMAPDYVPGLVERALFKMRIGEQSAAAALMREVLRRIGDLPGDTLLPGPEPLPVSFYRESAGNFLRSGAR